jgi:mono/diheme cytochrome c family protein
MAGTASAADGKAIVAERCVACHNVTGPAPTTLEGVQNRKAPDLFYAGSKFNRDWLARWIQNPTRIRPSGTMFLNHIVTADGRDWIDNETIRLCAAKLDAAGAATVAEYLATLKDPAMRVGTVDRGKRYSTAVALRLFTKQYPCIGCHTVRSRDKVTGGVSGPSLAEAGERLNPDWVYARIENPQHWDPMTWMPKIELSHEKREMLTLFVISSK